jgi:hypothetical protein
MRKDSCRSCGYELQAFRLCQICEIPTTFHCPRCDIQTNEQFHNQCRFIKSQIPVTV